MALSVEPVLTVLIFSALAAAFSAAGVLPFYFWAELPLRQIGWAYALASGLMLGAGYLLMVEGLVGRGLPVILGGGLGVAYTWWTHRYSGTGELETRPASEVSFEYGYKVILLYAMHSASEGVAIGVGMAVNLRLGVFMAAALALHNAAEATALTEVLRGREMRLGEAAGLSVVARVPQTLLALVSFSVIPAVPWLLPWALGFAAGTLLYLVMTELLPASYERAGNTGIALVVSFSAGVVVFLKTFFV
jgi:ZIP family zinc transporter